jgi:hypothetical protein
MRAITVRQPWAWAIVHGGKDVENRSRNIAGSYRGPVAIHASAKKADDLAYIEAAVNSPHFDPAVLIERHPLVPHAPGMIGQPFGAPLYHGAIVGLVDLVAVHRWSDEDDCNGTTGADGEPTCSVWGMADHHHLVLANPLPLARPIPATGRLGLWALPDDIEARVREQVTP